MVTSFHNEQIAGESQQLLRVMMQFISQFNSCGIVTESISDQQLMLAYQGGDTRAFEDLYLKHKDALYRFVLRHGLDKTNADEIYQEIWSAVIKARLNYRPEAKFTTWIYQIARNKIADYYRKSNSQFSLVDDSVESADLPDEQGTIEHGSFREQLLDTVSNLPFIQRQTFLLYYESALSVADIAAITESDKDAVKSRLRYAVKKLKSRLGKDDA